MDGIVLYPPTDSARGVVSFTDGLKLLASRMKRLGYPFDCSVDITRCFSLIWSDFVVGIFAARSIKLPSLTACFTTRKTED